VAPELKDAEEQTAPKSYSGKLHSALLCLHELSTHYLSKAIIHTLPAVEKTIAQVSIFLLRKGRVW
jgi:hypothetical protein